MVPILFRVSRVEHEPAKKKRFHPRDECFRISEIAYTRGKDRTGRACSAAAVLEIHEDGWSFHET
jgi:hypothetical protein